ncbi:N-6 DNA methylase [Romboutsia timonensis]|jgi:type I restriction enzyme M protein|uniref:N-6 DNA methylase n=1 Tax=Romboutsia timonensis TaxID=1776391 RepID=UPI00266D15FB|nr:N-6 DNA methylase [uncultured Romboutsia sp.]
MANERLTEDIVREHFKRDPLFSSVRFEEQKSTNIRVNECLSTASKSNSGNPGRPEFIITFPSQSMEYVVIVECKPLNSQHESQNRDKPKDYAVDGVLHYSKFLSKKFNVISIAVSGEIENDLIVTQFIQRKDSDEIIEYTDTRLLSIYDYVKAFQNEQFAYNLKDINIIEKAVKLNADFQECSISEDVRNTIVSGILLALQDNMFKTAYMLGETSSDIADTMLDAIRRVLTRGRVRRIEEMMRVYSTILNEPLVMEKKLKRKKRDISSVEFFKETIKYLEEQVYPLLQYEESGYDILGRFYTEFIRYAASQQKQGLVLTPSHITELFCDLAELNVNDVIYDCCCGTGGFLIAGMKYMIGLAGNDNEKKENIRKNQLLGIELRPKMFTFACSNMMLRGDGKSNIDCGDSFDEEKIKEIKNLKPTVAFLNPPYDLGPADQMRFIEKSLDVVKEQNGRVVAIVQMSCAIKNDKDLLDVKKRILNNYTLRAVISMPDDLFYPVGVVTCIMVFDATKSRPNNKTWFGYLKDDGYVKRKNKGRIDVFDEWKNKKAIFLDAYSNLDEVEGISVKQKVAFDDEWCAEAYMKTNYSELKEQDFKDTILKYVSYNVSLERFSKIGEMITNNKENKPDLENYTWKEFKYSQIFNIKNGYYNKKPEHVLDGQVPFIGATENNNGVTELYSLEDISNYNKTGEITNEGLNKKIFNPNCITVSNNGSVGYAFYQEEKFTCSHDVNVLYLKDYKLNQYISMFLITLIELEQFRWCYGRKWRPSRMPDSIIKLPILKLEDGSLATNQDGDFIPDWEAVEKYIKSIQFS